MYSMMKKQNFGIEIELTGITRQQAAKVIADYFGTTTGYAGTHYDTYTATDRQGRIWKAMSDGSIRELVLFSLFHQFCRKIKNKVLTISTVCGIITQERSRTDG